MHVCITLRFAGTRYHGFQVQKNALSVCEVLQNALESLYGVRPPVKGCSRTDSGVHALGYCVSYTQPKPIPPRKLPLAVNRFFAGRCTSDGGAPGAGGFPRPLQCEKQRIYLPHS